MMLKGTYFPTHDQNRMAHEGDVEGARRRYLTERPANLTYLLRQRYAWMNAYLAGRDQVVELGSGAGFAREFLDCPNLILTDVVKRPWIDMAVDALDPPFEDGSLDAIICSHMIHHLASPKKFLAIARSKLKPRGLLVIQEINTSLVMRMLLRMMRHEGWSYDIDVFDENAIANDPSDPWSANCAIPMLLFDDGEKFRQNVTGFKLLMNSVNECLLFPLSGGVIAKTGVPTLPHRLLDVLEKVDRVLVATAPRVFALGRSVVLEKSDD